MARLVAMNKNVSQSSVMVCGGAGGVMVVIILMLAGGTKVP